MTKSLLVVALVLAIASASALAVGLDSVSLGFHLIPDVDRVDGARLWDLSLSLELALNVTEQSTFSFLAMVDSGPTTLGTSIEYSVHINESVDLGGGLTILWPFDKNEHLLAPMVETYARAAAFATFFSFLRGGAAVSFPALTLAKQETEWKLIPLAQLPSLALSAEAGIADGAALASRITLQPVLVDTTQFVHPIGRMSDSLLILPMGSVYMEYLP